MLLDHALLERRQHGDPLFPLRTYFVVLTPGPLQQVVAPHWHPETELVVVTKGAIRAHVANHTQRLSEGQMLLVNGGEVHSLEPGDRISEAYAIVFDMQWLSSSHYDRVQHQFLKQLLEGECQLPMAITGDEASDKRIVASAEHIVESFKNRPKGYELHVKAELYLIVYELISTSRLLQRTGASPAEELDLDRLTPILTFIHEHYAEPISVKTLAQMVPMSEGYFCRHFRRQIGMTPVQYINQYRVNRATSLLKATDCSIMEAAYAVGFQNANYFARVFKNILHISPSDLRRTLDLQP